MYRKQPDFPPSRKREREDRWEKYLYVLDYLELGNPTDIHPEHRNQPFIQGIGDKYFTLMEAVPLPAARIEVLEKVDLTPPSKVKRIIHITYNELTSVSRANLPEALRAILTEKEKVFVEFFNIASPINIRLHALELLPEVGKKTMGNILNERMIKRFESYEDIKKRTRVDPVKALTLRIIKELEGGEKYYLFVKPREPGALYLGYLERLYGEAPY